MPTGAEANLSALIESSEDPIWSVDAGHRLVTFNRALQRSWEQNFGVWAAAGMTPRDFPDAGGEAWVELYDRALQAGPFRTEFRIVPGKIFELCFNPIIEDGRATGVSVFSKDVTQRRQAEAAIEAAIEAAEKRYRDLFDGAIEGMFQTSLVDSSRHANRAVTRMLGYDTPEELIAAMQGEPETMWVDPAEREKFRAMLYRDGSVHGYECHWKCKDGTPIWVSMTSRVIFDKDRMPISHEGFVKNITERKMAEMKLRDSEERFRSTFEQAAVGIMHVSFDGEILACNPRIATILAYSQQELVGLSVLSITPPDFLPQSENRLVLLRSPNTQFPSWEKPYVRKDGTNTWVRITASIQHDGAGKPLHHISFVEDINAERMAEQALATATQALKTSETRYRTVFQTMLDSVVIGRASDGMFVEVNEAFVRLTGYRRDEVLGRTAADVNIFGDGSDTQTMAEALQRDRSFRDIEIRFRKKNGVVLWGGVYA
jgi:PAS domain S-box-containing protein